MTSLANDKAIILSFSNDEAIVLLEWIANFNSSENSTFIKDQAEQRVLFDIETELEKSISEIFSKDYSRVLAEARAKIRDIK